MTKFWWKDEPLIVGSLHWQVIDNDLLNTMKDLLSQLEPETDVSMVAAFVEGAIDEQAFRADKAEQQLTELRTEYKQALEALSDSKPNLICVFTTSQGLPACDSFSNPVHLWCGVCKRRSRINQLLTTPLAIATMKGEV